MQAGHTTHEVAHLHKSSHKHIILESICIALRIFVEGLQQVGWLPAIRVLDVLPLVHRLWDHLHLKQSSFVAQTHY